MSSPLVEEKNEKPRTALIEAICKGSVATWAHFNLHLGIEWVSAVIKSRTKAGYYPGAGQITVKVLAERGSGRLLGGQIVELEGSAK